MQVYKVFRGEVPTFLRESLPKQNLRPGREFGFLGLRIEGV